jgi:hypothetical protein
VPNMRVVARAKLEKLKQAVVVYAVALAEGQGRWGDEHAVSAHLAHGKLDAGNLFLDLRRGTAYNPVSWRAGWPSHTCAARKLDRVADLLVSSTRLVW